MESNGSSGIAQALVPHVPSTGVQIAPSEGRHRAGTDHEIISSGQVQGTIELTVPDLAPTDNAVREVEVQVERIKRPVRITYVEINALSNGFKVTLPEAGADTMFGPDGSQHVFMDKTAMLQFVATVLGQVTYVYSERAIRTHTDGSQSMVRAREY